MRVEKLDAAKGETAAHGCACRVYFPFWNPLRQNFTANRALGPASLAHNLPQNFPGCVRIVGTCPPMRTDFNFFGSLRPPPQGGGRFCFLGGRGRGWSPASTRVWGNTTPTLIETVGKTCPFRCFAGAGVGGVVGCLGPVRRGGIYPARDAGGGKKLPRAAFRPPLLSCNN